ncbi:MAG: sulfatase-like hydrolase/transferase, partial [Draconibacterium sp.]|nr:sulfatase-like hydrolase/transferase [Draconibacterium sp.]
HTPIVPAQEFYGKSNAGPYGDLVHQTDFTIGEILKALERNNLDDNTIVIFTSDNGSPARAGDPHIHGKMFHPPGSVETMFNHNPNAPLRGMKADIYEGGHRVPFIVKWPGNFPANSVSNEPICAIDIMATLANIVNYDLPYNSAVDSYDLTELFSGKPVGVDSGLQPLREAIVHHSVNGTFAIRKGNWKMIPCKGSGGWQHAKSVKEATNAPEGQLYNLKDDPAEENNLWNIHPEIVKELELLLEKYKREGRSVNP